MRFTIFIVVAFALTSCLDFSEETYYRIHPDFEYYVNEFYDSARAYGYDLQKERLSVDYLHDLEEQGAQGRTYYSGAMRLVALDYDIANMWVTRKYRQDSLCLERLIFHELGHALLHRDHIFDKPSIMNPGRTWQDYYTNEEKRAYYIRELFDPATPRPAWAK
jgi:hypothetical protein